jgi:hypothetical protein
MHPSSARTPAPAPQTSPPECAPTLPDDDADADVDADADADADADDDNEYTPVRPSGLWATS